MNEEINEKQLTEKERKKERKKERTMGWDKKKKRRNEWQTMVCERKRINE